MPVAFDPKATHVTSTWKHAAPLINCRFDPQGRYVFATAEDRQLLRWELAGGELTTYAGHESWARGIAFDSAGDVVVTSGYDDTLIWWPAAGKSTEPIRRIKAHEGWIRTLSSLPSGNLLASAGNDHVVRLWNLSDGTSAGELAGHEAHVYSSMFHPDGQRLLTGDLLGKVIEWDLAARKAIRTLEAKELHTYNKGQRVHYGGIRSLALCPDGKHLACGGLHKASNPLGAVNEPLVVLVELESLKTARSLLATGVRGINWRTLYHPSGTLIGVSGGSGGGFLLFWKEDQDKEIHKLKLPNTAREMDLHPDGLQVATAHHDRQLRISRMEPKA